MTAGRLDPQTLQQPRIAIQGGRGSWSDVTLRSVVAATVQPHATADAAWQAVLTGRADAAWLASRNSTMGEIHGTAAARRAGRCWMEASFAVRHALLARPATRRVDVVHGHPAALAQCRAALARLAPGARLAEAVDGAHAAPGLAVGEAVLGPAALSRMHGLRVLADDACDQPDNRTTFQLLLAPGGPDRAG